MGVGEGAAVGPNAPPVSRSSRRCSSATRRPSRPTPGDGLRPGVGGVRRGGVVPALWYYVLFSGSEPALLGAGNQLVSTEGEANSLNLPNVPPPHKTRPSEVSTNRPKNTSGLVLGAGVIKPNAVLARPSEPSPVVGYTVFDYLTAPKWCGEEQRPGQEGWGWCGPTTGSSGGSPCLAGRGALGRPGEGRRGWATPRHPTAHPNHIVTW